MAIGAIVARIGAVRLWLDARPAHAVWCLRLFQSQELASVIAHSSCNDRNAESARRLHAPRVWRAAPAALTLLALLAATVILGAARASAQTVPLPAEPSAPTVTAKAAALGPPIDLAAFDHAERRARLPNGTTLGYVDLGPRSGKPVVLIHGFTNDARNWVPLLPYLDPALRLIIVDLRGHGRSSKPECCYSRIDLAYDIRLLMDSLRIDRADLVGHSLGSIVAQTFAEHWPARTGKVVLISSSGGFRPDCTQGAGMPNPPLAQMRTALLAMKDPIDPNSPFMDAWYGTTKPADAELLKLQRRDAAAIPVRVWLAVIDEAITGIDLQSTLPRLTAPVLLIWGAKDTLIGERDRCSLTKGLPAAQVHVFADLDHNPFWQDPAAVAAVIDPFLAGGS